jgi:hypothetical protein
MPDYSKQAKKRMRELIGIAYERELRQELDTLYEQFQQWRQGTLDIWDMKELVHIPSGTCPRFI